MSSDPCFLIKLLNCPLGINPISRILFYHRVCLIVFSQYLVDFTVFQKLRPSNHATIQSIVNAVGLYADVPAPCCVPDVMTSVTLLYFDENRNVVLKNYPGMSVQSCACR